MESFFYRVKDGEDIKSLSVKFQIPTTVIIAQNRLTQEVCAGDLLFLTKLEGVVYNVGVLDTLESVAKKFNVPPNEILQKNKTPYLIYGEIIII